ncbi:hypothetical protein SDC9_166259 [bioreactor metagenome]|uniref:Uncharacterized protein n=1 Tax=bioreactor metagenome TaxID=1076179 RepID=A0A645G435_9ZZZZ
MDKGSPGGAVQSFAVDQGRKSLGDGSAVQFQQGGQFTVAWKQGVVRQRIDAAKRFFLQLLVNRNR